MSSYTYEELLPHIDPGRLDYQDWLAVGITAVPTFLPQRAIDSYFTAL